MAEKPKKNRQESRAIREMKLPEITALLHDRKALTARAAGNSWPVVSTVLHGLLIAVLCVTTFFQVMALIGISQRNARIATVSARYNSGPLMVATMLMIVFTVWFLLCRSKLRLAPLVLSAGVAVLFVVVALQLGDVFQVFVTASETDYGLTTAKMIYRHMSPVLVPVLMIPSFFVDAGIRRAVQGETALLETRLAGQAPDTIL